MKKALTLLTATALIWMIVGLFPAAYAEDIVAEAPPVAVQAAPASAPQVPTPAAEPEKQPEMDVQSKSSDQEAAAEKQTEAEKETEALEQPEVEEPTEGEDPVVIPEVFTGSVKVELVNTGLLYYGDEIILRAKVENANIPYTLRWEVLEDKEWTPIANETKAEYRFIADETNALKKYRVVVITES